MEELYNQITALMIAADALKSSVTPLQRDALDSFIEGWQPMIKVVQ